MTQRTKWLSQLALLAAAPHLAWLIFSGVNLVLPARMAALETNPASQAQEKETPQASLPQVIPEEEKNRKNPVEPTEESRALGKKLFSTQCKMCHGEGGRGDGDLAAEMNLKMPNFTDAETQKKRTDGELFYILSKGHGEMPGQGTRMRGENKWSIINYLRTLAAKEKDKPAKEN